MNKIKILSCTSKSYADHITAILRKGSLHANYVYEAFFRQGKILESHPAFNNAPSLLKAIIDLTDFSHLPLAIEKSDGFTGKFLVQTFDKMEVEAVMIPMRSGGTLCISSQVGCRMGCAFCETGKMGLLRNLTAEEIVSQVFLAKHHLGFTFRNIVFMGMGEPFDNYDQVFKAVKILQDPKGFGFGHRRMTVSTSGCIDGIEKLIQEGDTAPNLAVSVNATSDEERNRLMPINKKFNMKNLHLAMDNYIKSTGREILVAYVLLKDLNDTLSHAMRLAEYLKGLKVKINLIPYNPQTRDRFSPPSLETVEAFAKVLREAGYRTLLRTTKGQSIMAACGQLGNTKLRLLHL